MIGRTGRVWHEDYFDRYMRDETHLERPIRYVEQNAVKANIVGVPGDWPWGFARFR